MWSRKPYSRVVVKLSGESLKTADNHPVDPDKLGDVVKNIASLARSGVQVVVVIGGGNFGRGRDHQQQQMHPLDADRAGMIGTAYNAQRIAGQLRYLAPDVGAITFGRAGLTADVPYDVHVLLAALERGSVAIIAGGMGEPGVSTDVAAVYQAAQIGADAVLMSKYNVDGVYSADPNSALVSDAKFLPELTAAYAIGQRLKVMDLAALGMAIQHSTDIHVFGANDNTAIVSVAQGAALGSIIWGR